MRITCPILPSSTLNGQDKSLPDSFTYETKPKSTGTGHHSHGSCCWCLLGIFPAVQYFWGVGLAREGSPWKHVLFIQPVTRGGLFWFLFNVSSEDRHVRVRVLSCYFGVSVYSSSSLLLSVCFSLHWYVYVCVCLNKSVHVFVWVFHPWRDEKPTTICYAAVGHNRQHCCGVQQ